MPISWNTCVEIGKQYTATVSSTMNMLGNFAGFVAPVVFGFILQNTNNDWSIVMYTMAAAARRVRPLLVLHRTGRRSQLIFLGKVCDVKIDLSGRAAVIVGASGGLGEAMAHTLSGAGAAIALVGRNQAKLDKVTADLQSQWRHGGEFHRRSHQRKRRRQADRRGQRRNSPSRRS